MGRPHPMPIVTECSYPGCDVRTIGSLCLTHDLPVRRTFPRGRALRRSVGRVIAPVSETMLSPSPTKASGLGSTGLPG